MRQNHNMNRVGWQHADGSIFGLSTSTRSGTHEMLEGEISLSALPVGATATVLHVYGGRVLVSRLATLGFTPEVEVRMIQNFGHGPVIVCLRGTRLALGRREAGRVHVQPVR